MICEFAESLFQNLPRGGSDAIESLGGPNLRFNFSWVNFIPHWFAKLLMLR